MLGSGSAVLCNESHRRCTLCTVPDIQREAEEEEEDDDDEEEEDNDDRCGST